MKLITAVIKPTRLELVIAALKEADVKGLTVTEASGFGHQGGESGIYRGAEYTVDLVPKVRLEMVVADREAVERVANILAGAARTGTIGDGKIWVTDVEWTIRIRTGEMNEDAL
jgi:nitrogen regulatory protein P-II 1